MPLRIDCPEKGKICADTERLPADAFQKIKFTSRTVQETAPHSKMPASVGMHHAASVHFQLPVSLRMVRQVVEQGKWNSRNSSIQSAVTGVQPFAVKISWMRLRSLVSVSVVPAV